MEDVIHLRGALDLILGDAKGNPIQAIHIDNTVVTAGRRWVLQQINSSQIATAQSLGYVAVGTSTTAPATSDTVLGSEQDRNAINNFTTNNLTSNPPSWRAEVSWNTNEANTTLGEAGMFNSSSGGTMFSRATFATVNKTTSNTLAISWTVSG